MTEQIRLNKYLASCGLASRREADELIKAGKVIVNDKVVDTPGVSITEKDIIKVNGKVIKPEKKEYVIFNKPPGYITSSEDEKRRKTIYDVLPEKYKGLKPAGRLDKDTSGLLILTNDGELINKLTHPKNKVPKVYSVIAEGKVTAEDLAKFHKGIEIEKGKIAYAEAIILDYSNAQTTLQMTLYQGYNRQIRRMLEAVGHPVAALKRIAHANIRVEGLKKGQSRYLSAQEVRELKNYLVKYNHVQDLHHMPRYTDKH
ncbi:MAG: hypothetical protein A2Y25_04440 [Candidatus Melainabacteria bacterium GWF2_37_15]|nr:MAG: hypothetical protein A2Y25_04440 [Candidatus Melainabacteria bacterium GWF2_37_15]